MSECRPGVPSGLRKRSLSPSLPLRMRHRGSSTEFNAPGPSSRAGVLQGRVCHPNLHGPAPPKPGGLGWNWSLGKTAHFTGTEALPSVIPHRGTKLGTLAQRWGMGGRVVEPITHTRTGSKTKGNSNFS